MPERTRRQRGTCFVVPLHLLDPKLVDPRFAAQRDSAAAAEEANAAEEPETRVRTAAGLQIM